MAGETN
jgi:hypothetical protein